MNGAHFDDAYWATRDQSLTFRHRMALAWCDAGPVLDIGCGDGLMLDALRTKGIAAVGIDHSATAVEKCRAKGLEAYRADEPRPEKEFACTLLLDVLEHTYDPDALLSQVRSPQVIISVPNFVSLPARLQVLLGRVPENNRPHQGHVYWFTLGVLKALLARQGFRIERFACNTQRGLGPLGRAWPSLFGLSFIVLCRKT